MNPYVGLEEYITWENCKIGRGKFLLEKDFRKLSPGDQANCKEHRFEEDGVTKTLWFQARDTSRTMCVGHLNAEVPVNQLFTSTVITQEVLEALDPIIGADFNYGTDEISAENFSEMLEDTVDGNENN